MYNLISDYTGNMQYIQKRPHLLQF